MDPETQAMVEQLAGGFPTPQSPPPDKSSTKGLSPEALAALFLVPGSGMVWDHEHNRAVPSQTTVAGQSGPYNIIHDKEGKVGGASLTWQPEARNVRVDYISAPKSLKPEASVSPIARLANSWAHNLGTVEIRSLLKSLAQVFPKAETVGGLRISGARDLAEQEALKRPHIIYGAPNRPPEYAGDTAKIRLPRSQGLGGAPGQKLTDLW